MRCEISRLPVVRRGRTWTALSALALVLLANAGVAHAGFSISIYVDGGLALPPILDNSLQDLNPALHDITYDFNVADLNSNWTATGTIYANGGGGTPPVSTIVTDTLIEKNTPGLHFGEIRVVHDYAASGLFNHTAHIDGQFENTMGNVIGGAELNYIADVNTFNLGVFHDGPVTGVFVHPFTDDFGPLLLPTTTEHEITLQFYLDEPGDAIRLFNSAEIHTLPEPSSMCLAAMAVAAAVLLPRWRRRKR